MQPQLAQKRVRNFVVFRETVKKYTLLDQEDQLVWYESYSKPFPNKTFRQGCVLCQLPQYANSIGIHEYQAQILCGDCYSEFVDNQNQELQIAEFEKSISSLNAKLDELNRKITSNLTLDDQFLTDTFLGFSVKEVEFALGNSIQYGDFDRGLSAGNYKLGSVNLQVWFQSEYCVEVNLVKESKTSAGNSISEVLPNHVSVRTHVFKRVGIFLSVWLGAWFLVPQLFEPIDKVSIVGKQSTWVLIGLGLVAIFVFVGYLGFEAFGLTQKGKRNLKNANLAMILGLIMLLFLAIVF
jgi:hypothetical protein